MRRALALAAVAALTVTSAASAETWTKYIDGPNGTAWSFDGDYTYRDRQTGRLVVMQAVSKPEAKLGPAGPGKSDGVGNIVALDCANKNMIMIGSYKPSAPYEEKTGWRLQSPKKADGPDNEALMAAVCPMAAKAPSK
ncbi:MAG: hypothetical protein ACK56C_13075 [Alphaproteobacteria bacterium]